MTANTPVAQGLCSKKTRPLPERCLPVGRVGRFSILFLGTEIPFVTRQINCLKLF